MIDWNKSAELNKCSVNDLKARFERFPNSHKKVVAVCDGCGEERVVKQQAYRDLCQHCGHDTNEFKHKISEIHKGKAAPNKVSFHINVQKEICMKYAMGCPVTTLCVLYNCHQRIIIRCLVDNEIDIRSYKDAFKYKKPATKESRERMSAGHQGVAYDEWIGYSDPRRIYLKPPEECLHLNNEMEGHDRHHITSGVIINVPMYIHKSIGHRMNRNIREGKNMGIINRLAFDYLMRGI